MAKIAILGTGAWGSTLANVLLENKHEVYLWGINGLEIKDLRKGFNKAYFGNKKMVKMPKIVTNNFDKIANLRPKFLLLAIPSQFILETLMMCLDKMKDKPVIINVSKGLDNLSNDVWSKSIKKNAINKIEGLVSLSGPSFAIDVFAKHETVVNVFSDSKELSKKVKSLFDNSYFKCVISEDEIGSQFLGALKNVIAIGMGIVYTITNSQNTRAALLCQGIKELSLVLTKLGGKEKSINEFCGIGDIYLTCTDKKSRNFSFGVSVAQKGITYSLDNFSKTVEGYIACKIINNVIKEHKLNCPFISEVYMCLFENHKPKNLIKKVISLI